MPGVSVLPPTPPLGPFGSSGSSPAMHNALQTPRSPTTELVSISEIKETAKEHAHKNARGASALSLIKTARTQVLAAHECELSGDLKGALSALINAGTLAQMFMDSAEFNVESAPGKKGVLYKEFIDFSQHEGSNLKERVERLTAKLEELEHLSSSTNGTERKSGGSIADRMRSLQDAGLSVSTTKRFSREPPAALPTPPISPEVIRNRYSNSSLSSASASASSNLVPPATSTSASASASASPSPHAFVPLSSLGPPSPTSSPSSSPQTSSSYLTEFSQAFPSIDELDEWQIVPPMPTNTNSNARTPPSSSSSTSKETTRDTRRDAGMFRSFPILPVDPGPRPSSTPNTPTTNSFASRPASPTRPPLPIPPSSPPLSPTIPIPIPRRPSGLGLSMHSPKLSSALSTPPAATEKHGPPVTNSVFPKLLHEYMYQHGYKVLLLDVRNREEFDREHIKGDAIVCIEPSVLLRQSVSGSGIENSLHIAPRHEWTLFCNRDKFDLIVMYDSASEKFGSDNSPLMALSRAIYENEFRKMLKRMPVLLVGGLDAWRKEFGEDELVVEGGVGGEAVVVEHPKKAPGHTQGSASISKAPPPPITPILEPSRYWTPPAQDPRDKIPGKEAIRYSLPPRSSADPNHVNGYLPSSDPPKQLSRKPTMTRPPSNSLTYPRPLPEPGSSTPHSMTNGISPIQYPQYPKALSPATSGSSSYSYVSLPPQASINPTFSRRRSDYVDQSQEAISGIGSRPAIDYPELSSRNVLRPPPAAASSAMERQDNRPRVMQQRHSSSASQSGPKPPTIPSDYPVTYWSDTQIGTSGLKNLGNTCYMNATIQCLSATVPFARFFTDGRWKSAVNMVNPMGTKGNLAHAFADILHEMWQGDLPYLTPYTFRRSITSHALQFGGSDQHDSQEFLSFLLDGLHEDLNRILHKPTSASTPEREAELERLPQQVASDNEWKIYRMRNDSLIVDFFQGQFRNRLECLTCHKTSTTYNSFMYLSLPLPTGRGSSKVSLTQCLDAFVKSEVMEKTDAWHCPSCKTLRRATKQLSLSRLPPVLLIHLKRFQVKGPFTDKIETLVEFPLRSLDLTNYMPPPLPPGVDKSQLNGGYRMSSDDPRAQLPPYRYDLYSVTNHSGNLSNGHYTAFIASRGGWLYCDDSRVQPTDAKEVVGRRAYILFYKRSKL